MKRILTLAAMFAAVVLSSVAALPEVKAASNDESAVAEKWIAAWNSRDAEKFSVRGVSVMEAHREKIFRDLDFHDSAIIMRELRLLAAQQSNSAK